MTYVAGELLACVVALGLMARVCEGRGWLTRQRAVILGATLAAAGVAWVIGV